MTKKLSLALIATLCITNAHAMTFQTLGYKSVAMGGAGVASSSGSVATYNNPALLAKAPYDVEISLGGGVSVQDFGAAASFKNLQDSGFIDTMDKANNDITSLDDTDKANLESGKDIILGMNGDAIQVAPQAYFAAQMGSFGLGVFGTSDVVATTVVDQTHDKLYFTDGTKTYDIDGTEIDATQATYNAQSMQHAIENGDTYVNALGIAIGEVPIAYGHKLELSGGNLMLGGALKYMQAVTYTEKIKVDNDGSYSDNKKKDDTSTSFGVDLGLAYEPAFSNDLTFAVVGKNLNTPEFTFADGGTYKADPMLRVGVAYDIVESLEVAADYDLTKNKTFVSGVESQMVGGGLNWHPTSWFALRGGAMKNLDVSDKADLIYTAGLGFGLKWLQVDLSGQMSSATTTVNDSTVPQYAKVNLAIISRW